MSQKFLTWTDAVRAGFACAAVFCGVLTAGLWCDRLYERAVQPVRGEIETIESGTWADVANGGLVADPEMLNFGRMMQGTPFRWNLKLSNPTEKLITISRLDMSCGISVRIDQKQIPPGGTTTIQIEYANRAADAYDSKPIRPDRRLVIPIIPDHPGKHPGWEVSRTIASPDDK